jgi:hypothetical protein
MFKKLVLSFLSLFIISEASKAQKNIIPAISSDFFRSPLDIPLYLAGSFGEIRPNHFHSGLDIKTNQKEGYPVYAVADGYISRLRVQIGGFGNALYINHPNGLTSVYAHLQKFNPRIALALKQNQYRERSFTQDFLLTPIEIPVKKGEIIAYSGNTGGSAGPHLHFEIRNTLTEETINPLIFGFDVKDNIKPIIGSLYVYYTQNNSFTESTPKQYYPISGSNGNYSLSQNAYISVNGEFGLGITTYDQHDGTSNKNGLFSTEIKLDGEAIYETIISKFSFDNTRAANAYIDYATKINTGLVIQKGFTSQNPKVKFYSKLINNGLINLTDNELHQLEYTVSDIKGNQSVLKFKIKNNPSLALKKPALAENLINCLEDFNYQKDELKIFIPKGILYNDLDFKVSKTAKPVNGFSEIYKIQNRLTPLHNTYRLSILPNNNLVNLEKVFVYSTSAGYQDTRLEDGYLVANPKIFGDFYLRYDSIPPTITPINITEGVNLGTQKAVRLKISDSLSGIKNFNMYIDNQWVLADYEYKNGSIWHTFDEKTGFGKHTFKLVVTDNRDNMKTYLANFFR